METRGQEQEQEEDRIGEAEIRKTVEKMKMKKAVGIDGIPTEAWKYAGERLWNRLVELLNMIWHNGTIPED